MKTISEKIKDKEMSGKAFRCIFRLIGGTEAVVEIEGKEYFIDDSSRLVKQAGMIQVGGRGKCKMEGKTCGEINKYFAKFPKIDKRNFL